MSRQPLENIVSHAVVIASGIVEAEARSSPVGTLNAIFSSAIVYCEYAPRPLISPANSKYVESTKTSKGKIPTSPDQCCDDIALLE